VGPKAGMVEQVVIGGAVNVLWNPLCGDPKGQDFVNRFGSASDPVFPKDQYKTGAGGHPRSYAPSDGICREDQATQR
jgi:hypothetical protein